jgi:hypothetical protein
VPQPPATPRRASSSTQRQKGLETGTSLNIGVAPQAGGAYPAGSLATSTKTAICARVVALVGQYVVAVQPPVTFLCRIASTKR